MIRSSAVSQAAPLAGSGGSIGGGGGASGTPRHRRLQTAQHWPEGSPDSSKTKRTEYNGPLMFMLATLAAVVVFSLVMWSTSGAPRDSFGSVQLDGVLSKRSRKLENGQTLEDAQRVLAAGISAASAGAGYQQQQQQQQDDLENEPPEEDEGEWWHNVEEEEGAAAADTVQPAAGTATERPPSPYQQALQECRTLKCLKDAAGEKRYRGQFLFPHFFIIGWQKCATTSLYHHLKQHPHIITPVEKEPEFFSDECGYDPLGCALGKQEEYITKTINLPKALKFGLTRAMFEGSTHYGREGAKMARGLRQLFPWAKLIASFREPISRYLSMLGHNLDKDTYTCLRREASLFDCLVKELPWNNYTSPLASWLQAGFPPRQLMLLQYESLTSEGHEREHLREVKTFLGLDPDLADAELPAANTRAARLGQEPEGWPMLRWQYEKLIEVVRPDCLNLADIVDRFGFGSGEDWLQNWEQAWQENLDRCGPGPEGACSIR